MINARRFIVVLALLAVGALVYIPWRRQQVRSEIETAQQILRQQEVDRVRQGARTVTLMDSRLLPMLADDTMCVNHLNELSVAMTDIPADDAVSIVKFVNLESLSCYDVRGVDSLVEHAAELSIKTMSFQATRLSKESLKRLANFPALKKVHFGYVIFPNEMAVLAELPKHIVVEAPYLAENEPGFQQRARPLEPPD